MKKPNLLWNSDNEAKWNHPSEPIKVTLQIGGGFCNVFYCYIRILHEGQHIGFSNVYLRCSFEADGLASAQIYVEENWQELAQKELEKLFGKLEVANDNK